MSDELIQQMIIYAPSVAVLMWSVYQRDKHISKLIDTCIGKLSDDCVDKKQKIHDNKGSD